MSTPFIGMNPQLESPDLRTEVHHRLISAMSFPNIAFAEYETKLIPKETLRQKLNEFYELLAARTDTP
jgi:Protein of unknown function (DUF4058)